MSRRRELAKYAVEIHGVSERLACRTVNLNRCSYRYQTRKEEDRPIAEELRQLAERHPRWGCGKMTDYLKSHGHRWNHKRIRRIYRDLALHLHRKPKKRLAPRTAQTLRAPGQSNQVWSLDFMSDALCDGRTFRTLNIMDDFNREALWIEIDTSLPAERVVQVLERLIEMRGTPRHIRMDHGPELISQRLTNWASEQRIELLHIQPGKPAQNGYIERFNRTYREEILDAYSFDSLEEVRTITEQWLEEYNSLRPHDALQGLSPYQFAHQHA